MVTWIYGNNLKSWNYTGVSHHAQLKITSIIIIKVPPIMKKRAKTMQHYRQVHTDFAYIK